MAVAPLWPSLAAVTSPAAAVASVWSIRTWAIDGIAVSVPAAGGKPSLVAGEAAFRSRATACLPAVAAIAAVPSNCACSFCRPFSLAILCRSSSSSFCLARQFLAAAERTASTPAFRCFSLGFPGVPRPCFVIAGGGRGVVVVIFVSARPVQIKHNLLCFFSWSFVQVFSGQMSVFWITVVIRVPGMSSYRTR